MSNETDAKPWHEHANRHASRPTPAPDSISKMNRRQKKRLGLTLSTRFNPRFFEDADQRLHVVQTIKKQVKQLIEHTGCDSMQKELICKRAVFISILLETIET